MNRAKLIVALAVCLVAWSSWFFRYDLRQASHNRVYLLDRWTGSTYFTVGGRDWREIKIEILKTESVAAPATGRGFIPLDVAPHKVNSWDEVAPVKK